MVGEGGFEPPKSLTTDLQSVPFGHSGTHPYKNKWSWWTDSNPRPADYKSAALPTELHQRLNARILYHTKTLLSTLFAKKFQLFLIYFYVDFLLLFIIIIVFFCIFFLSKAHKNPLSDFHRRGVININQLL